MDIPTIQEFLKLMSGPAGWAMLGPFFSTVFAKWPWFESQSSQVKQWLVIGASIIVSGASYALATYVPNATLTALNVWFYIVYGAIGTYTGSQVMHILNKNAKR